MLERGLEHVGFRVHYAYRLITIVYTKLSSLITYRPRVIKISLFPLHHFASVATLADLRKVRVLPPSFPSWKIFSPWSGKTFKTNHFKHQHADFSFITILCVCMSRRCWWCSRTEHVLGNICKRFRVVNVSVNFHWLRPCKSFSDSSFYYCSFLLWGAKFATFMARRTRSALDFIAAREFDMTKFH